MLRAAGARRVAFHLGTPWPPGWRSSGATRAGLLDTFAHLADADVLLTAVSGFSKAAPPPPTLPLPLRLSLTLTLTLALTLPRPRRTTPQASSST